MEKHKTFLKIDLVASKKTFSRKFAYEGRLFYLDRSAKFYFDKEYNCYGRTEDFGDDFYKLLSEEEYVAFLPSWWQGMKINSKNKNRN